MSLFSRRGRTPEPVPQPLPAEPVRVEVHVTADGRVDVAGRPVVPGVGEPVQDAVLDYLHRQVLSTGVPVLATVRDERIGWITPIQVHADGSSRFAAEPIPLPEHMPRPQAASEAPAPATVPAVAEPAPASAPQPGPAPVMAPEPDAKAVTPVAAGAVPAPEPAGVASPPPTSPDLIDGPVARINEAIQRGWIEWAAGHARESTATAAESLGWDDPGVLRLRELNAYVAFVAGDVRRSFNSSLEIARIRSSRQDPLALQSVHNAAAAWAKVAEPVEAIAMGRDLVALWVLAAPEGFDTSHLDAARARIARLEERAAR